MGGEAEMVKTTYVRFFFPDCNTKVVRSFGVTTNK